MNKGALKPLNPEELLEAWLEAYDFSKHQIIKGHVAARSGEELLRKMTRIQRWRVCTSSGLKVTGDFLIPPSQDTDKGGDLRHIEKDFAAVITPGLRLAFQDQKKVPLKGVTLMGEKAEREIWVCGPGAFIVLKALAFHQRGENVAVRTNAGSTPAASTITCIKIKYL
ncbi:MAG: hypothetical protein PVI54_03150 [Desulfobacteraceae bacterium]|jgi:hypothetical protein